MIEEQIAADKCFICGQAAECERFVKGKGYCEDTGRIEFALPVCPWCEETLDEDRLDEAIKERIIKMKQDLRTTIKMDKPR